MRLVSTQGQYLKKNKLYGPFSRAVFLWTDSKTNIQYIQNEKGHFPIFAMHHINEIRQFSEISDWHYIPSEQNPSDPCTRTQADFKLIQ